jgi:hypothetical protein
VARQVPLGPVPPSAKVRAQVSPAARPLHAVVCAVVGAQSSVPVEVVVAATLTALLVLETSSIFDCEAQAKQSAAHESGIRNRFTIASIGVFGFAHVTEPPRRRFPDRLT